MDSKDLYIFILSDENRLNENGSDVNGHFLLWSIKASFNKKNRNVNIYIGYILYIVKMWTSIHIQSN